MLQISARQPMAESASLRQFESISGMKRLGDVVISCAAIIFSLPLIAIIALTIKLHSRGPVLIHEERRVAVGRRIRVLKFRTTARQQGQSATEAQEYPTAIGQFLYYTRLVDLPQLINVLRGEMSLIDPKAVHPDFFD
jgi:polysaccharide biosynthesis protein PslA